MLPSLGLRSFGRLRYPRTLDHGVETVDTTQAATPGTVWGNLQPAQGQVDDVNRDGAESSRVLWAQPGSDVCKDDRLVLDDGVYRVVGEPQPWLQTGTSLDHLVVNLSLWEG
jgi:hypothetical protein